MLHQRLERQLGEGETRGKKRHKVRKLTIQHKEGTHHHLINLCREVDKPIVVVSYLRVPTQGEDEQL